MDERKSKKWHYSMLTGIMYGRIPVGLILVLILFAIYLLYLALKATIFF